MKKQPNNQVNTDVIIFMKVGEFKNMIMTKQYNLDNAMANVSYSNEIFKQYLLEISTGLVWKNTTLANSLEPDDVTSAYQTELFVTANRGLLNFFVIKSFPRLVLKNAGIPENLIELYASDKNQIPENIRNVVVDEYTKALTTIDPVTRHYSYQDNETGEVITIYEEKNNYYRMLSGLPDIGDTDYVYNTDPRWDTDIPIHQMRYTDRIEMENLGVLDTIIKKYPNKKYLNYLGRKYINFFSARIADRFEILYKNDCHSDVLNDDFLTTYNHCRLMVKAVYYSKAMSKTNELYDNFMAMSILFMTLQYMQHKYLQVDITRDFYDVESLKLVYDSYSVPFYSEIPLDYHRKIVKNINKLISYKGSSKVFFDLFDIFDLGSMNIYSYFITKIHRVDANGKPYFIIKEDEDGNPMYDDNGDPILDEKNYTLQFSKVKIYDDPALSVSDRANDIEYEYLTVPDPYWIEDYDLQKKLSDESFNYLETKYIGIQTIFDLMKITYENAYIFRLITDNKDQTDKFIFRWTDIGINCSIFDLFIYLASLYCRYYHYEGLISDKIPAIADTIGYNYEEAIELLQEAYNNEFLSKNKKLLDLIQSNKLSNLNSVNTNYENILEIQNLLIEGFTNARTIEEFDAYRNLYNSLLISREVTATYTDPETGEIFESFTDVLSYYSPDLMQRYLLLADENIQDEMTITIDQIEKLIPSMRYLPFSAGVSSSAMIESLFKILKFFKSAKAELIGYNITYKITMRGINFFKMLDLIASAYSETRVNDDLEINDYLNIINAMTFCIRDANEMIITTESESYKTKLKDYILSLVDSIRLQYWIIEQKIKDEIWYNDLINKVHTIINLRDNNTLSDTDLFTLEEIFHESHWMKFNDNIMYLTDTLIELVDPNKKLYISDNFTFIDRLIKCIESIFIPNKIFRSDLHLTDLLYYDITIFILNKDRSLYNDYLIKYIENGRIPDSNIYLKDKIIHYEDINLRLPVSELFNLDILHKISSNSIFHGDLFSNNFKMTDMLFEIENKKKSVKYNSDMIISDSIKEMPEKNISYMKSYMKNRDKLYRERTNLQSIIDDRIFIDKLHIQPNSPVQFTDKKCMIDSSLINYHLEGILNYSITYNIDFLQYLKIQSKIYEKPLYMKDSLYEINLETNEKSKII